MGTWDKALFLAVLHHGLSCLAARSIPAKTDTVLNTAKEFAKYLDSGEAPENRNTRR